MNARVTCALVAAGLALAACGSGPWKAAARPEATPPAVTSSTPVPATPALPAVPDFHVVAYQGDEAFGGHEGHFSAVFAAGRPVVLLYFAGL